MLQSKDIVWLNGYKNKTRIYAVTRDPLQIERHTQTGSERMEKRYSMQMGIERKRG